MTKAVAKKTAARPAARSTNVPARVPGKKVGAANDLSAMMDQDAGKGVSTLASDNVIPLIYLLQSLSPQCLKQRQEYVTPGVNGEKGAVAGNIWFRGSKDLVDGEEEGMLVQLCHFRVVWVEWGPERGDGLRGRHDTRPKEAVLETDPKNPKKKKWVMPDGNVVVETREHVVLVHDFYDAPSPFVIAMSGSNHQPAKQWMTDIGRKRNGEKRVPLWACYWRMKTIPRTDGENNWFSWSIEDEDRMVDDIEVYKMGKQLYDDFEKGVKEADSAGDDPDHVGADHSKDDSEI